MSDIKFLYLRLNKLIDKMHSLTKDSPRFQPILGFKEEDYEELRKETEDAYNECAKQINDIHIKGI